MNSTLIIPETAIIGFGLAILLFDLWTPQDKKPQLGYVALAGVILVLAGTFAFDPGQPQYAFGKSFVIDPLALFFKRFFLVAALFVIVLSMDFADRLPVGIAEFYALTLFALAGMLFAASANDFILVFVSLELITITFYVLTSFQRGRLLSLEAGVKYLILGALSTAFTVYGIAFIFGIANSTNFNDLFAAAQTLSDKPLFLLGILLVLVGLAFKIAAFPCQIWAPDVYQGSPTPATAFLAVGSKAAGIALLMRVLFSAVPQITVNWNQIFIFMAAATILYGNLCAIPQRNLKRLLGYSSIANAGYLLLGIAAANAAGASAILYYLGGYLFTVIAAFVVISIVSRHSENEDISIVSGLGQRSPLLGASLALSMVSLAGIPPLAGFFGKFLLLRSIVERGASNPAFYILIGIALMGIVISFYYYLGVVRAIYWSSAPATEEPILLTRPMQTLLYACIAGMLYLGLFPNTVLNFGAEAVRVFKL